MAILIFCIFFILSPQEAETSSFMKPQKCSGRKFTITVDDCQSSQPGGGCEYPPSPPGCDGDCLVACLPACGNNPSCMSGCTNKCGC
uniref:Uncharacterized protein n=1 Tax=Panagrolaimus sp. PS1159 TaxID=55785 RepID=A0AC35GFQ2_9BILA